MTSTVPALLDTRYIELRGNRFAYSDSGAGPLVLNLHGLTSSRSNDHASGLATFDAVAAAGRRLISYDARGHGESGGSLAPDDYRWDRLALDLLAFADHFSPDEPVSAIGCSMGTGTILHAVTARPERFDELVLTAPPTAWNTRAAQGDIYRQLAAMIDSQGWELVARTMAAAPSPPIFEGLAEWGIAPDIRPELISTVMRGAGGSDLPPIERITSIEQATLLLPWATDPGHPVSTAERLYAAIPGSSLEVATTVEQIRGWGARAAEFLRR
ncbi:alpha/beta fold hydrolase [Naasia lichenicola]|uniref:Alpha/beta hydrolase n=1 Tax=Naasia lichenicola TaxID=2565933 RepID=A0A4S4FSQ2_9MICO|nr:alpha/beta hydrolase [Naasia lichenicola]THG33331.1 alpha/beta hydrolase [Naasia lichenicola]